MLTNVLAQRPHAKIMSGCSRYLETKFMQLYNRPGKQQRKKHMTAKRHADMLFKVNSLCEFEFWPGRRSSWFLRNEATIRLSSFRIFF